MKKLLLSALVALGLMGTATFSPAIWACCGPIDQPEIAQVNADPNVLWPPNHKMVEIQLEVLGNDKIYDWAVTGVAIINQGQGEGKPTNDPDFTFAGRFLELRSERSGKAGMRTYVVTVTAYNEDYTLTDTDFVYVNVPHNMGE